MLGNSLPVGPAQQTAEKLPKILGVSTLIFKEYAMHIGLHKVFPGILQVIISNGMVISNCRYRIRLPEELISIAETDLWTCQHLITDTDLLS